MALMSAPAIDMRDKVALVTGAGRGIGRGIAEAFADLGAQVAVLEIDEHQAALVRDSLAARGSGAPVGRGDASRADDVAAIVQQVEHRYGRLDVLVNNVGSVAGRRRPFSDTTADDWQSLYEVNLLSAFVTTHQALPAIRKAGPGASIINVSTIEAFRGIPLYAVYSAFKTGLTGFTRSLALELGPEGIRVNAIAPETTETETLRVGEWLGAEHSDDVSTWIPLGRFGTPRDAAGCAIFLATELSAWVTGTTVHLDGGALAASGWVKAPGDQWTNAPVVTGPAFISRR
jgi:NAD(P)-dependent dehydrogenase (short-subunit alcohol dehydrogenase family)